LCWWRSWNGGAGIAETTVKRVLCCGFRHIGKAMRQVYQCWWSICREINVISSFECHYVLRFISICVLFTDSPSYNRIWKNGKNNYQLLDWLVGWKCAQKNTDRRKLWKTFIKWRIKLISDTNELKLPRLKNVNSPVIDRSTMNYQGMAELH
jgi:hypothetical protein